MPKNDDFEAGLVFFRRLSAQITTIASTYDKDYPRFARLLRSIQCDLDKGVYFLESGMSNTELAPAESLDDQIENTRSNLSALLEQKKLQLNQAFAEKGCKCSNIIHGM